MKIKLILLISLFCSFSFAKGEKVSLKALPQHGNIKVNFESLSGDKYLIEIRGLNQIKEQVLISTRKERQAEDFVLESYLSDSFRLYSTSKITKLDGSIKKVFELYIKGQNNPIRLTAVNPSSKSLKRLFKTQQQQLAKKPSATLSKLKKQCGSSLGSAEITEPKKLDILQGFAELCSADEDYKEEIKGLKIAFKQGQSKAPTFKLKKKTLFISTGTGLYNGDMAAKYWLEENL